MKWFSLFPVAVAVLAVAACSSTPTVPSDATPQQVLAMANSSRNAGHLSAAVDLYQRVYEDFPRSAQAEPAEWFAAETAYSDHRYAKARDIYEDYHEYHPVNHLGELADRMYDIGEKLYDSGKSGLLGLGIFTTSGDALTVMTWITENLRKGKRADDAYMFIARTHIADEQYQEATTDLQTLVDDYPESKWAPEAQYLLGVAWFALNRGPAYDGESLLKARKAFKDYLHRVERSPALKSEYADRIKEAKKQIAEVNERLAEKDLLIAAFYRSVERPKAAEIYEKAARKDYPDAKAVKAIRKQTEKKGE